jgi:hypothetical protein
MGSADDTSPSFNAEIVHAFPNDRTHFSCRPERPNSRRTDLLSSQHRLSAESSSGFVIVRDDRASRSDDSLPALNRV